MTVLRTNLHNTRDSARQIRFEPTAGITATNVQKAVEQGGGGGGGGGPVVPTNISFSNSPYTVLSTDTFLAVDTAGGAVVIDLVAAASRSLPITIKDMTGHANTNPMSIVPNGAETIDGLSPYSVGSDFGGVQLIPQTGGYMVAP